MPFIHIVSVLVLFLLNNYCLCYIDRYHPLFSKYPYCANNHFPHNGAKKTYTSITSTGSALFYSLSSHISSPSFIKTFNKKMGLKAFAFLAGTLQLANAKLPLNEIEELTSHSTFNVPLSYNYNRSTTYNYRSEEAVFVGKYKQHRSLLDYNYHAHYTEERQLLQDKLIDQFLQTRVYDKKQNVYCETPLENWIVFTAGVMGAGKGHTIQWLNNQGLFPMEAFVNVDPDTVRMLLPETREYNRLNNRTTGFLTQKEVGYISEVLSFDALHSGKNVLVDGSLRDAPWYLEYFSNLRSLFPNIKIAILHVEASIDTVLTRAAKRAQVTHRIVPESVMLHTIEALPQSLAVLSPKVEFYCNLVNEDDEEIYVRYCEMKAKEDLSHSLWKLWRCDAEFNNAGSAACEKSERKKFFLLEDGQSGRQSRLYSWQETFQDVWNLQCARRSIVCDL